MNSPDTANQLIAEHYDRTQYASNAFFYSSPGHLRAAAHLYGVETVPVTNARVLELGCAAGGNLLPFVLAYPDAQAVGVDLSPVQIQQGQKVVRDLDIKNLDLRAMSLTDIDKDFGEFDYIIVHGVFSWVPPEVRQAILRICRENLSPKGIAYISYNTYPGWKAGDIVRDAMLLHSHAAADDDEKLASAKAMLTLLSDGLAENNPLAPSLRGAVAQLKTHSDYYVAHEYLEAFNSPCYFLEFADAAQQAGLMYVGDAEPQGELSAAYGQNVQLNHSLIAIGQPKVLRQQYLDFSVGRNFRKSMIIAETPEEGLSNDPDLSRLGDLRWAGFFTKSEDVGAPRDMVVYINQKGRSLNTREPEVIAVLDALSHVWPASMSLDELTEHAQVKVLAESGVESVGKAVQHAIETLFKLGILNYSLGSSSYDDINSDAPQLIPGLAHMMEQKSQNLTFGIGQFNFWHDCINLQLKEAEAFLVPHINGKNTENQLRTLLRDALHAGIVPATDGNSLKGQRNLDAKALLMVSKLLDLLRRQGALLS